MKITFWPLTEDERKRIDKHLKQIGADAENK